MNFVIRLRERRTKFILFDIIPKLGDRLMTALDFRLFQIIILKLSSKFKVQIVHFKTSEFKLVINWGQFWGSAIKEEEREK